MNDDISQSDVTTEVTTEAETKPETESDSNSDEVSLEILREKLKFLESRMGLDAEVLVALNKTLTVPQTRTKIYQLFLNLVTKLEEKELGGTSTTTSTVPNSPVPMIGKWTLIYYFSRYEDGENMIFKLQKLHSKMFVFS